MTLANEEMLERRKLVGFCETDQQWYKFTDNPEDINSRKCTICGDMPSSKIGFQMTTQRTFDPRDRKMTKSQIKKMGSVGA